MFEREQKKLVKHFDGISAVIQELRVILDELYMNEKLEDDHNPAYSKVINSLDKLYIIRRDFEELRDKVRRNDV
tara:strand:+ start:148 stop:369 length:222 start_codon:yes stop_codon:yes gene_type:complete